MNRLKSAILAATILAACGTAQAQQIGSTTIQAQATVPIECRVNTITHIVFPNYDIVDKNSDGSTVTAPAAVGLRCTGGGTFFMQIGGGLNPVSANCADARRMKNESGNYLGYSIIHPKTDIVWSIYSPAMCDSPYSNSYMMYNVRNQTVSFSARIKHSQYTARVGQYTDTLTVYLTF